jgi:hypothetical protein
MDTAARMAVSKHVSWGLVKQCKTEVRAISTTNNLGLICPLEMARLKSKACMTAAAVLAEYVCARRASATHCNAAARRRAAAAAGSAKRVSGS